MEVGEAMNDSKQALELGDIPMVFLLLGVPFCTEILVRYFSDLDLVNPEVGRVIRLPIFACAIFVFLKIIDCLDRRIQERHCFKVQQDNRDEGDHKDRDGCLPVPVGEHEERTPGSWKPSVSLPGGVVSWS